MGDAQTRYASHLVDAMRKKLRSFRWGLFIITASLAGWAALSCAEHSGTVVVPTRIEGATYVGNQVCYDCHTNISRVFHSSPHARLDAVRTQRLGLTGCESCHGPGSKHVAAGGGRGMFIVNPRREPQACLDCHLDVEAQFHLPHHHPLTEGRLTCVNCHDPHGMDIMKPAGGLAMARNNEQCAQCHREQSRQFVFEHEALREGCTECHEPHGAIHAKMLTERDNNLCLRCHAQVPVGNLIFIGGVNHTPRVRQGSCWSAGCHSAVHGSNIHPRLLY